MNNIPHKANAGADEAAQIGRELRAFWHGLIRESERAAQIDRQQYWALSSLSDGPLRMTALAERMQTSQASLTGIVDRLEERGHVARVRSSEDRRVVEVEITESGVAELARTRDLFSAKLEAKLKPLTDSERTAFLATLRTLNAVSDSHCG
ncbi:MAG: MarR family transcriptional regulator [Coriobacteriia bacterium]|nr:MarR family transcriptional regulator [Coriobacteriia bacterium]